jgi:FKBP-type peptidyl-prolyl cis-trans isomerase FklB
MKQIKIFITGLLILSSTMANAQNNNPKDMKSELDTISQALGLSVGKNLLAAGIDSINFDQFVAGLNLAYDHKITPDQLQEAQQSIDQYVKNIQAKKTESASAVGTEWLAANAKKEGVVTLPSGLQYKIITDTTGPMPMDGDDVTTHYTGSFIDGKIFDSSVQRGTPATFGVNQVIKGWTEALKLMPKGSKWELYIPYDLAYGPEGRSSIPPYSTLIFQIELLSIDHKVPGN